MKYWLAENPTGKTYTELIKILCNHSDTFYFVTRATFEYKQEVLEKFKPYVIKKYKTKKWENNIISGPPATLYVIESNKTTCKLLQRLSNSIYEWVAPNLPEDLTFMRNEVVWFSSTSHEKFGYINIDSEYDRSLIANVEGLKLDNY